MKKLVLVLFVAAVAAFGYGLEPSGFNLVGMPDYLPGFHPDFSGYVSFSFSSGPYGSTGRGTYLGRMSFSLHPNVDAVVDLGYSRLLTVSDGRAAGSFLGGMQLNWRPTENTVFSVIYRGELPDDDLLFEGF